MPAAVMRRQATLTDFVTRDTDFMQKICTALTTIHETYGYQAVQDCLKTDDRTGEAQVNLDILCAMLDRSKSKIKSECCSMFFASKHIIGAFMYLFGSLLYGTTQFFYDRLSFEIKALISILATCFYLAGGVLYMFAAIEPYWNKNIEINKVSNDVQTLRKKGSIVRKMSRQRKSKNKLKTRLSNLNIDTRAMLNPTEIEQEEIDRRAMDNSLSDIFEFVANEQRENDDSSKSSNRELLKIQVPDIIHQKWSDSDQSDDEEQIL